jgi:hypothetical protein
LVIPGLGALQRVRRVCVEKEDDMAKGQEKAATKNKPKLSTKEKQEKKKLKKEGK